MSLNGSSTSPQAIVHMARGMVCDMVLKVTTKCMHKPNRQIPRQILLTLTSEPHHAGRASLTPAITVVPSHGRNQLFKSDVRQVHWHNRVLHICSHSSKVLSRYARTCAGTLHRISIHASSGMSTSCDNTWQLVSRRNATCTGKGRRENKGKEGRGRTPRWLAIRTQTHR